MNVKSYLEITMKIDEANRPAAAKVYNDYRAPFLKEIPGALTKNLLIRDEDVQMLHGFDSAEHAKAYLSSRDVPKRRLCRPQAALERGARCKDLHRRLIPRVDSIDGQRCRAIAAESSPRQEWGEDSSLRS